MSWGVLAAVVLFFVAGPLNGLYLVAAVTAPLFGLLNWWLWRQGGPAHRWREMLVRRFPPRQP